MYAVKLYYIYGYFYKTVQILLSNLVGGWCTSVLSLINSSFIRCVTSTPIVLKVRMRVSAEQPPSRATVVVGRTAAPPPTTGHASRHRIVSTQAAPPQTLTTPTLTLEKDTTCGRQEILQVNH